ncbi:hypothetical protein PN441_15010 [Spirulina major CS-329]|uniref:hypothetical protein n=1 Tax=Spirulina TaxID=1154 RepID=UPI00232AEC1D|nr:MULTISPECIES: hypothetical protein [Spirulina]MDB9494787.1 hypothetical protein [Spirulina subsalsa CS-330]MDB9504386.1 hypothetical protein [Spirulina major CS-329]
MTPLDVEELAILESVELGEWRSIPDLNNAIAQYQQDAQVQLNALEFVNIELPLDDLQAFRIFAQQSGVSVSVLISTVLHQFIRDRQV